MSQNWKKIIQKKTRGIFIKFKNPKSKADVYAEKKMLTGTGILITEDLTSLIINLLTKVVEKTKRRLNYQWQFL